MILSALLKQHGRSLNNKSLITLLTEVESIVNSRPLTEETLGDVGNEAPLSPINLLTMKSNVVLPPPGDFKKPDLFSRRRWRRIQHITDEFWCQWRKEFLANLHCRAKWQKIRRKFKIGDILILKNYPIRNQWPMAKVIDVYKSNDGHVRTVKLRIGDNKFNENGSKYLVLPFHKIQLLFENDEVQFPDRETEDKYNQDDESS